MDTLFPDLSEHNRIANDSMALAWRRWSKWISFRVNDGSYVDRDFKFNDMWRARAVKKGWLIGYICYMVYPPSESSVGWPATFKAFFDTLGSGSRPRMVVMIDVERWARWDKDMSLDLTTLWTACCGELNRRRPAWQKKVYGIRAFCAMLDRRRVIAYGNAGDLTLLWPHRPKEMRIVLADYTSNMPFPGKVIHQFSSHYSIPGMGFVDINSADGLSPNQLARRLGLYRLTRRVM